VTHRASLHWYSAGNVWKVGQNKDIEHWYTFCWRSVHRPVTNQTFVTSLLLANHYNWQQVLIKKGEKLGETNIVRGEWGVHWMRGTLSVGYIEWGVHWVWSTLSVGFIVWGVHWVRGTLIEEYTEWGVHWVRGTLIEEYTEWGVHWLEQKYTSSYIKFIIKHRFKKA
jgi:hypothetical protein